MERAAYEYFARIDELGGMVAAIEQSFPQREMADASFRHQQQVDSGERIVVGVNEYLVEDDDEIPTLRIDPALEKKQKGRVEAARLGRDSAALEAALAALRSGAANDGVNLMPPIIECARAGATEGEMVIALQEVFGTYTETPVY